jgi:hypothetical protein
MNKSANIWNETRARFRMERGRLRRCFIHPIKMMILELLTA